MGIYHRSKHSLYTRGLEIGSSEITRETRISNPMGWKINIKSQRTLGSIRVRLMKWLGWNYIVAGWMFQIQSGTAGFWGNVMVIHHSGLNTNGESFGI